MNENQSNSNYSTDPTQLVPLWEEMGASTGGLIGRFIGLNFLMGSRALEAALNPISYSFNNINGYPMSRNNNVESNYHSENKGDTGDAKEMYTNHKYYITFHSNEDDQNKIKNIIKNNNGSVD